MHAKKLVCFKCGEEYSPEERIFWCKKCGYSLDIWYDYKEIKNLVEKEEFLRAPVKHWKYWMFYPVQDLTKVVSMHEGGTALIKSRHFKNYWFKFEGVNPTGSFKDRGSTIEITKAIEKGEKEVLCASTGNMGASIAAYSARAGIKATIFVPKFASSEKIRQIQAYGASVKRIAGTYEHALEETKRIFKKKKTYLTGDYYYRAEGQKSVGFEIIDQLNWEIPENIVLPVGNGTLMFAVFKACKELKKVGLLKEIPKIFGVQASGCNSIKNGKIKIVKKPKTLASAIDCGNPIYGLEVLKAIEGSKGGLIAVSDKEMMLAMKELASEGIFAELSGAASLAGAKKFGLKEKTVCIVSGHGLKECRKYF
jgi:threonine synthase